MGFYERHIAPAVISCACSARPIQKQRAKIVPKAFGEVLELGMGAGANLPFYDRTRVTRIRAVEPSQGMRGRAMAAARASGVAVELEDGRAEVLPYDAASFDCVVCTYTLCTVQDVAAALSEAKRVLKPGGQFLFCEHGLAEDEGVARWQRRLEPLWKPIGAGCHMTRQAAAALRQNGFTVTRLDKMFLPNTPRVLGWTEWGEAGV